MDFRTSGWLVFIIVAFTNYYRFVSAEKLRLCIVESVHTTLRIRKLCPSLTTLNSPIACVTDIDRLSCLRRLTVGDADFTVLEPEDLVAVAAYSEYNVLVTNELRAFEHEKQRFQMVALVHKNIDHIWDVKGKRLCHPGLETVNDWTKAISMYFENWVIPIECDSDMTLLENRMHALSTHFDMACIAGPWLSDTIFDAGLKFKYKNLCSGCDNPAGCTHSDKYYGREGALLCLTDNVGDVAWVRLDDTLVHFKGEKIDKRDYNYLCQDGGTRPVEYDKPCVWISKPWPVIVANSQFAEKVARTMNLLKNTTFESGTNVLQLMEGYHISPVSTENLETPEDYLRRFSGFMSAYNRASCQPSRRVQWCVASNLEDRKCRWLREASIVYGIEPPIFCIQQKSRSACIEALQSRRADIFVAKPEEFLEARKKGLEPIVYAMSNKKQELNRFAAIVKHNSRFKSLKDLKGAKAIFTSYRSVAWNAFVSTMWNASAGKWDCSDIHAVAAFFSDSCVLDLKSKDKQTFPTNLYSLCKQEERQPAGDDVGAYEYLTSGLADVAFVNLKAIEKKVAGNFDHKHGVSKNNEYRTLCLDEQNAEKAGPCLLTWTPLAAVVTHENITNLRYEEIYSMLLEMDNLFGTTFKESTPAFSLYGTYDTNHSVIFPEETRHLQLSSYQMPNISNNYEEIIEEILYQETCNAATERTSYLPATLHLSAIVVVLNRFMCC